EARRFVVGLGLMDYAGKYSVRKPSNTTYRIYMENLVKVAEWLLAHDYEIRLLIGDVADLRVTQEFRGLLNQRVQDRDQERIIEEPVGGAEDLFSQIAKTDIVVATRFHNVLMALVCGKPVISISFHHKCESLMSAMGLSDYCLDINELKADGLIE